MGHACFAVALQRLSFFCCCLCCWIAIGNIGGVVVFPWCKLKRSAFAMLVWNETSCAKQQITRKGNCQKSVCVCSPSFIVSEYSLCLSLSLSLSLFLLRFLFLFVSIILYMWHACLSLSLYVCLSLSRSLSLYFCVSGCILSLSLSVHVCVFFLFSGSAFFLLRSYVCV